MAIILFTRPVPFPIGPLRQALSAQLPLYRWRVGEDDDGGAETMGRWDDVQLIVGRTDNSTLFCEMRAHAEPMTGDVPLHRWHLDIRRPTSDIDLIAHRVLMLVAAIAMIADDAALCQIAPGGGWLSSEDMVRATKALLAGESLERIAGFGRPAASFARGATAAPETAPAPSSTVPGGRYDGLPPDRAMMLGQMDESMARILHERGMGDIADGMGLTRAPGFAHEMPRVDRLPTMVMLATAPLILDWALIREGLTKCDPQGGWRIERSGPHHGVVTGRGGTITLETRQSPLPSWLLAQAQARSHGLSDEDKRLIGTHHVHHCVTIDLDTRAADYVAVRETAKCATLLIGLAARRQGFVGLFNAGVGTVMPPARVMQQLGILARDEVPITLWTWAAFHSTQTDAISISTGGMMPFTGYEIETWGAPGTLEQVAERLNGVLRYLLINGPMIAHGDTIGDHAADRSTRCFLGESKADRGGGSPVPALLLEFDDMGAPSARAVPPRPDTMPDTMPGTGPDTGPRTAPGIAPGSAPVRSSAPAPSPGVPLRRGPGGFGRKGL